MEIRLYSYIPTKKGRQKITSFVNLYNFVFLDLKLFFFIKASNKKKLVMQKQINNPRLLILKSSHNKILTDLLFNV